MFYNFYFCVTTQGYGQQFVKQPFCSYANRMMKLHIQLIIIFSLNPQPLFHLHRVLTLFIFLFFIFLILIFKLFWFRLMACGILVPRRGTEPRPLAVRAQSPNHWTTREFPTDFFYKMLKSKYFRLCRPIRSLS